MSEWMNPDQISRYDLDSLSVKESCTDTDGAKERERKLRHSCCAWEYREEVLSFECLDV